MTTDMDFSFSESIIGWKHEKRTAPCFTWPKRLPKSFLKYLPSPNLMVGGDTWYSRVKNNLSRSPWPFAPCSLYRSEHQRKPQHAALWHRGDSSNQNTPRTGDGVIARSFSRGSKMNTAAGVTFMIYKRTRGNSWKAATQANTKWSFMYWMPSVISKCLPVILKSTWNII